jgi:hypothetical protein
MKKRTLQKNTTNGYPIIWHIHFKLFSFVRYLKKARAIYNIHQTIVPSQLDQAMLHMNQYQVIDSEYRKSQMFRPISIDREGWSWDRSDFLSRVTRI